MANPPNNITNPTFFEELTTFEQKVSFNNADGAIDNTDAKWNANQIDSVPFDLTSTPPVSGDSLQYNGTNFVPGSGLGLVGNIAANTIVSNPTASSAAPQAVALGLSQLYGRGASGNLSPIDLGTHLTMSGTTLNASGGGTLNPATNTVVFTASGTYTPSANLKYALIICAGGGGGSGGLATGSGSCASAGGGSGAVAIASLAPATWGGGSVTVTIGSGGSGGAAGGGNGASGGTTSFGAYVQAVGGSGSSGKSCSTFFVTTGGGLGGTGGTGQFILPGNCGGFSSSFGSNGSPLPGVGGSNPFFGGSTTSVATANTGAGGTGTSLYSSDIQGYAGAAGICVIIEYIF